MGLLPSSLMAVLHVLQMRYLLCFVLLKATATPFLGAQDIIPNTHVEEGRKEAGEGGKQGKDAGVGGARAGWARTRRQMPSSRPETGLFSVPGQLTAPPPTGVALPAPPTHTPTRGYNEKCLEARGPEPAAAFVSLEGLSTSVMWGVWNFLSPPPAKGRDPRMLVLLGQEDRNEQQGAGCS